MYCMNCGRELEDGWTNCPYCGAEVAGKKCEMPETSILEKESVIT